MERKSLIYTLIEIRDRVNNLISNVQRDLDDDDADFPIGCKVRVMSKEDYESMGKDRHGNINDGCEVLFSKDMVPMCGKESIVNARDIDGWVMLEDDDSMSWFPPMSIVKI